MEYKELKKELETWVKKVLQTKQNAKGFIDVDAMKNDIMNIIEKEFEK